ncbi:MAG: hypothetical protein WCE62_18210 [Polyangiales bacterium]
MLGRSFTAFGAAMGVRVIRGVPMVLPVSPVLMMMVLVGVLLAVMALARMMFVLNTVMVVAKSVMERQVHHRHHLEAADPKQARQHGTPLATAFSTMSEVHNCRRLAASFCPINRNSGGNVLAPYCHAMLEAFRSPNFRRNRGNATRSSKQKSSPIKRE